MTVDDQIRLFLAIAAVLVSLTAVAMGEPTYGAAK